MNKSIRTEFVDEYRKANEGRIADNTLQTYCIAADQFLSSCRKKFEDISQADVKKWIDGFKLKSSEGNTIRTKIFALQHFFDYYVKTGAIIKNPAYGLELPEYKVYSNPSYIDEPEKLAELVKPACANVEEKAIVDLLITTGIMPNEVVKAKRSGINWDLQIVNIDSPYEYKNKIKFSITCKESLISYLETRNDTIPYLFIHNQDTKPEPYTRQGLLKLFNRCMSNAGFPNVEIRSLRDNLFISLAKKGASIESMAETLRMEKRSVKKMLKKFNLDKEGEE